MAWAVWLSVLGFLAARQLLLSRRTLFAWDWYSLLLFYVFLSYVVPALSELVGVVFPLGSYPRAYPGASSSEVAGMLLLVFLAGSWVGYSLVAAPHPPAAPRSGGSRRFLWGLTVILGAATVGWIVAFGGLFQAITSVMMIRFGRLTADTDVPWFINLTKAAWFCAVVAGDAIVRSRARRERPPAAAWVLLGTSLVALVLRGSRGAIGNVLLVAALYLVGRPRGGGEEARAGEVRRSPLALAALPAVAVAVVVLFKPTMTLVRVAATDYTWAEAVENFRGDVAAGATGEEGRLAVLGKFAAEFSHFPIVTDLAVVHDRAHPEQRDFGGDVVFGAGKLLPASVFEPEGVPLSYRSTLLVLGRWESQVPPGIVAWLIFTAGPLFLLPGALVCGLVLALAERAAAWALRSRWWSRTGFIAAGILVASGFVAGTPGDGLRELVTMGVVIVGASGLGTLGDLLPRRSAAPVAGGAPGRPSLPDGGARAGP